MVKHIYFMSDTHDDLEAVSRAVDGIMAEGLERSILIHGGDLSLRPYTKRDLDELLDSKDKRRFVANKRGNNEGVLDEYAEIFHNSGIPHFVIPGNYDPSLKGVFGERDLNNKATSFQGIRITGYGGGGNLDDDWMGPPHIERLHDMGEIQLFNPGELKALLERERPQVAVVHTPPYGHCDLVGTDKHVGALTTTSYIQNPIAKDLKLVLCGHIHTPGISRVQRRDDTKTVVINPGNLGRADEVDPETLEFKREFNYGTFVRVDVEDDGTPISVNFYSVEDDGRAIRSVKPIKKFSLAG